MERKAMFGPTPEAAYKTPAWHSDTSQRLRGKVALVTGGGSGIGQATALLFARQGAQVFASDINEQSVQATAAQAEAAGCPLAGVSKVDLIKEAQVHQWVADSAARAGGIDVIVQPGADVRWGWIEDVTLEDFRYTMDLENTIVFIASQAVWPFMKARGGGSIVTIASGNAHQALRGSPALSHVAAKGAVCSMTRQLAMEGAPHGIRANSISPGLIVSLGTRNIVEDPERAEQIRHGHMIHRLGQPADIAWAALYLASDESSWVTATDLRVDAGATQW
jgi:NAD(P)-dependent dehydrogenase (short-subunit alcohol dehydrogenase family)